MSFTFGKDDRLKKRDDIQHVFSGGRKVSCAGARLFYLSNKKERNRVLFTAVHGYGSAVDRNRVRRIGREVYRVVNPLLVPGYDMIVLFYPGAADFKSRRYQIERLFSVAGLWKHKDERSV